jgi:hypothetical protein
MVDDPSKAAELADETAYVGKLNRETIIGELLTNQTGKDLETHAKALKGESIEALRTLLILRRLGSRDD